MLFIQLVCLEVIISVNYRYHKHLKLENLKKVETLHKLDKN